MRIPLLAKFYVKRVCPYCFQDFYPGDCDIHSTTIPGKLLRLPPSGWRQFRERISPEPLTGREFTTELARRACPHCRILLPFNIESAQNISIAVVGDNYSGKSWFLAALMHQLEESQWITQDNYVGISCFNQDMKWRYINKLFRSESINFDDGAWDPLVFEINLSSSRNKHSRVINLIFYDTNVEDYRNPEDAPLHTRSIFKASAIIFLVDPASLPGVASELAPHLQRREQKEAQKFLDFILNLLKRYHREETGQSPDFPVAITISKSDLLKFVRPQYRSESFFHDCQYDHGANIPSIEAHNRNVKEILLELGAHELLNTARRFPNTMFFAVSATGHTADKQGLHPMIEPCRCLDPLLWILHSLHIITSD